MFKYVFLAFLVIPVTEVFLFINVGGAIGVINTIALVIITAFIGVNLFRYQGAGTWAKIQQQLNEGKIPAVEAIEGVMLLVAGALLLTPGFLTDAIGFSLLFPPFRRWLATLLIAKGVLSHVHFGARQTGGRRDDGVIEGEFRREP